MEGIMLYLLIVEVYNTELKLPLCYGFSFGELVSFMSIITKLIKIPLFQIDEVITAPNRKYPTLVYTTQVNSAFRAL